MQSSDKSYHLIKGLLFNQGMPLNCRKVYETYFKRTLVYGARTLTMSEKYSCKIQGTEMKFLRNMLGKIRRERI